MCNKSPVQQQCIHHVVCILCCTDHNQYHETFSCNKDSLCVLSSACSALNFRHIESVLIVFHTLTILCFCQTQDGLSPVYAASQKGHTEVVDLLVQAGADIHLATKVHVSTHTVSSSVAAVVETNVRLIEFVVYDLHFHLPHPQERNYAFLDGFLGWMAQSLFCSMRYVYLYDVVVVNQGFPLSFPSSLVVCIL